MSDVKVADKKKSVAKASRDSSVINISKPFNFRHQFHIAHDEVEERNVDEGGSLRLSPPPPCPGSKDGSVDENSIREQIPNESLSQILKDEIIPVLHIEIGNIVEKKLQKVLEGFLPDIKERSSHCPGCACAQSKKKKHEFVNTSSGNQAEAANINVTTPNQQGTRTQSQDSVTDNDSDIDRLNSQKPVSNPLYPISSGEPMYLPLSSKYGSEIHLVPTQSHIQHQSDTLQRSNTMPLKQGPHHLLHNRRQFSGRKGKPDDRECLAKALQANIVELTNEVIFKDSELPDSLLTDGCLTENESTRCRKYRDPRDQVRLMLSIIKGRDFDVLKRFLKHIKLHNVNVALKIEKQFEQNKNHGVRSNLCALCKLTNRVDLKYIADALYQHFLLDDGLYNIIFQTELPTGAQGEIWHRVFACLNHVYTEKAPLVKRVLNEALVHKDHYHQIAKEIQWMLNSQNEMSCRCEVKLKIPPGDSIVSIVSSRSPPTSISDVFEEAKGDNVHSVDDTDVEATTPVQREQDEQLSVVADSSQAVSSSNTLPGNTDQKTPQMGNSQRTNKEDTLPAPRPHKENILSTDSANSVRYVSVNMINEATGFGLANQAKFTFNGIVKDKINAINAQSTKTQDTPRHKPHIAPRKLALLSDNLKSSEV